MACATTWWENQKIGGTILVHQVKKYMLNNNMLGARCALAQIED